jgi:hypothetical protein
MQSAKNSYRGFKWGIGLGALAALALLVNSVTNYAVVSEKLRVEHLRQEMAADVAVLDSQIRARPDAAAELVTSMQRNSAGRIAWIQVRNTADEILAHAGRDASPAFTHVEFHERLLARKPAYRLLDSPSGDVVVEAFPIRIPAKGLAPVRPTIFRPVSMLSDTASETDTPKPARAGLGMVEIAAFTSAVDTAFWPLQRNLLINITAAIALLAALGVMMFYFRGYTKGRELEDQVAEANEVQRDLLAPAGTLPEDFSLATEFAPALGVSGDFYDAFPVAGGAAFVLGDVAGKGVPAALLMGVVQGAVRSSDWTGSARKHLDATVMLNRLLCDHSAKQRYASMFWAYFDQASSSLHYVNAGHQAPVLVRGGEVTRLEEGGPVLGLLPYATYRQGRVELEPGDTLLLFSDGIVEAMSSGGDLFGDERLIAAASAGGDAYAIRDRVLAAVEAFTGDPTDSDDRTLVVLQYEPAARALPVAA